MTEREEVIATSEVDTSSFETAFELQMQINAADGFNNELLTNFGVADNRCCFCRQSIYEEGPPLPSSVTFDGNRSEVFGNFCMHGFHAACAIRRIYLEENNSCPACDKRLSDIIEEIDHRVDLVW